jgi:tetratricopeptide (TPR) repeat protein
MRPAIRFLCVGLAVACVFLIGSRQARAQRSPLRGATDNMELERMLAQTSAAVPLITKGEEALALGDFKGALADFDAAKQLVPVSQLLSRRRCQTLDLLGQRQAALDACAEAIKLTRFSPALAMRASVSALMSVQTPTLDDLALALFYADQATSTAANLPWGYAASCDIAYRLGDHTLLSACQRDLARLAPNHYETERAAQMRVWQMPMLAKVTWGMLAMFSIFTLGHFLASTRRKATLRATLNRVTRVTALLGILLAPSLAHADDQAPAPPGYHGLSKWPVNQADPVSSVPTPEQRDSNPLEFGYFIMDLADLAGMAVKRGDFAAASRLYEATIKADPGVAVGYRNACLYSEKSGNIERALSFCRGALAVQGVLASDYVRYADLVFSEPTAITKDQIDDLQGISEHLKTEGNAIASAQVECDLATRIDDFKRLDNCVQVLTRLAPKDPKTLSIAWARALRRGDIDEAQRLVAEAKKSAMQPDGIQTMEQATSDELRLPRRVARHWASLVLASCTAMAVAIALMVAGKRRSRAVPG